MTKKKAGYFLRCLAAAAAFALFCTGCSSAGTDSVSPSPSPTTSAVSSPSPSPSPSASPESASSQATPEPTLEPTPEPTPEPPETVTVTFPEGFTVMQIAQVLEEAGVCDDQAFVEVAQNYSPKSFSVPESSDRAYKMEGYLFPDTYEFYVDDDPEDVLIRILNNYNAKAGGISDTQLIVASIVEKESRSAENAALVASVIYNRLEAGMRLEMDSTREYINQNVTDSPYLSNTGKFAALYNTYKCAALPAGPISNPGARAIQAAVNPASSDYLYFFFGNDNQNHYSRTLEEHEAAMAKYGVQYS